MILFTGEKQDRFEQFIDKMLDGNEVVFLEEILDKLEAGATVEELDKSFHEQCAVYFQLIDSLNNLTGAIEEKVGVLQ